MVRRIKLTIVCFLILIPTVEGVPAEPRLEPSVEPRPLQIDLNNSMWYWGGEAFVVLHSDGTLTKIHEYSMTTGPWHFYYAPNERRVVVAIRTSDEAYLGVGYDDCRNLDLSRVGTPLNAN